MNRFISFTVKESITVGIFTALMLTLQTVFMLLLHFLPGALVLFKEALVAMLTGPVYVVLWTKVPKRGVFTVCGLATALMFAAFGFFTVAVLSLIGGIFADLLANISRFESFAWNTCGYVLFSLFKAIGTYIPFYLWGSDFIRDLMESGKASQQFIRIFTENLTPQMGVAIMLANCIAAGIGAWAGRGMLRKHFNR